MTYDAELADRLRDLLVGEPGLSEKKMFGGLAFLLGGHMAVCASGQGGLMVRLDGATYEKYVDSDGIEPVLMRGRPMTGWVRVDVAKVRTAKQLSTWVARGTATARALPPKRT